MDHGALTIIAYDIRSNRRRRAVARIADDFGCRLQLSVFYAWLTHTQRKLLAQRLEAAIDADEDAILIIPACDRCASLGLQLGTCKIEPLPLCWVF